MKSGSEWIDKVVASPEFEEYEKAQRLAWHDERVAALEKQLSAARKLLRHMLPGCPADQRLTFDEWLQAADTLLGNEDLT